MKWNWILSAKKTLENETPVIKCKSGGALSAVIIYPNSYFTGMSNLGFHAVFTLLNKNLKISCERAFYPEKQYIDFFKKEKNLRSLETQKPLQDFDLILFSVSFESDLIRAISMLQMSAIPIFSKDRHENDPLVFLGGAVAMLNPEPIANFMDFIVTGRAESVLPEAIEKIKNKTSRQNLLNELSCIKNIYVPSLQNSSNPEPDTESHTFFSSAVLSESTEFKNTFLTEIMNGCPFSCNFCAVGNCFGKLKYRPFEDFKNCLETLEVNIKKIGLIGACINTHPEFDKILEHLRNKNIKIGFSSLRADILTDTVLDFLKNEGNGQLTLAPESGSEKLRFLAGKKMSDKNFYDAISKALKKGINAVKLYFMVGLPEETNEDILLIVDMLKKVSEMKQKGSLQIFASVSQFVPKNFTAFADCHQEKIEIVTKRMALLKSKIPKGIIFHTESPKDAFVQGLLAKGTRDLAPLLTDLNGEVSYSAVKRIMKEI